MPQPLCAVYKITAAEVIRAAVDEGERKITKTFEGLKVEGILGSEYSGFDEEGNLLKNVNRPEDL